MNQQDQHDQEAEADRQLDMLLSGAGGEAIIKATNQQFMAYAPMMGVVGKSNRLIQLARITYEFTVGMPSKLWNYWLQSYRNLSRADLNDRPPTWAKILAPVLLVVSIPWAVVSLARGFFLALWLSVVKGEMEFVPKQVLFDALRGVDHDKS